MRLSHLQFTVCGAAIAIATCAPAAVHAQSRRFNVPAQPASSGIRQFAAQAGIQITLAGADAVGRKTNAVHGTLNVRKALEQLISGTGLVIRSFDSSGAILGREASQPIAADQTIVVTGSRIPRPEIQSAMPVSVTNMGEVERVGRINAYDALMLDPAVDVGIGLSNSQGETWDGGVASVSLRGLGTNRSLTLIDGMRRVSGSARSSAVDLNMIPAAMIDRIEVVTGGAAAIYGADAVTGAVNVITKKYVEGFHISAIGGISQRGDAAQGSVSVATGGQFDGGRGSFAIGGTASYTAPLNMLDRFDEGTQVLYWNNPANTGPNDGIPDRVRLDHTRMIYLSYEPTYWLNGKSWIVENGVPREAHYDKEYITGQFSGGDGGDGRNLRDHSQIRGKLDSFAVLGRVNYDFSDALKNSAYFSYGYTYFDGLYNKTPYRDDSRKTYFYGAGGSVAYLDNPYLPPAVRQMMLDNGLTALPISRTYGNLPLMHQYQRRASFTVGDSVDAQLTKSLKLKVYAQYGRTTDHVDTTHIPYAPHWLAARDVIADPVTGQPVCRDPAARADGCVPLNIFGLDPVSDAFVAYALRDRNERRLNTQQIYGADISGNLFSLPYGAVAAAVGVEHRRETLKTIDDPLALALQLDDLTGGGVIAHPEIDAAMDVSEAYGELVVPLLKDLPFAKRLSIEGAYRYSHYNTIGNTGTWKAGISWAPISWLTLRGVRSRSVRAPNFGELYEPMNTRAVGAISDPCAGGAYYLSPTRAANCAALGITKPLGNIVLGPEITTGGNPDLGPETSNSLTAGVVLQPKFLPGFDVTADYWNIDIGNVITEFTYAEILNLCVDLPSIDNPYCARVVRDPTTGGPVSIRSNELNAQRMLARGIDLGVYYRRRLGRGQINLSLKGTYLLKKLVETTPGLAQGNVLYAGGWQDPRVKADLLATYDVGKFGVALNTRFVSAAYFDVNYKNQPEAYPDNTVPPVFYTDISGQYRINKRVTLGIGVDDIFDQVAPFMPNPVYYDNTIYNSIGRYFFVTAKVNI